MTELSLSWCRGRAGCLACSYLHIISFPFSRPLSSHLNTQPKPVPTPAMHLTSHFMALPEPLATCKLPYSECIMALWTDFSHQDPQILLAAVFFVFWKMNSSSVGEGESNLCLQYPCHASAFVLPITFFFSSEHCSWGTWDGGAWGAVSTLSFG